MKAILLLGTLVSAALAAEPECVPGFWNCISQDISVEWSNGHTSELCQRRNWIRRDGCFTRCPLKLTITEPAEYRMSVCLGEHSFKPYDTTQHLDLNHPLNNKELTVMAPPDGVSRMGCGSSDFVGANYTNALVVMNRGHCWFYEKFANAKVAGALAGVMVNTAPHGLTAQMASGMSGSSAYTADMQMGILPGHFGHIILEALDAGHTVKGMLSLTCEGDPPPISASQLQEYTTCPHPSFRGVCDWSDDPEKSLCNTCPLQMEYGNERVCLWGNDLQPRTNITEFQGLHELPVTGVDTVFIDYLPNQGCLSSDFAGLQGTFVLLSEQGRCTSYQVARNAWAAGVAGLAVLSSPTATDIVAVQGLSQFLQMPTHSVQPQDTSTIQHWFKDNNSPMSLSATIAYRRTVNIIAGYDFELKVPEPTAAPQESAPLSAVNSRPELEFTAAVIVNLVLLGLLLIALTLKVYHQRRQSVDVQLSGDAIRVPLAVALTSLCLSLLAAIAAVAFILAFQAGDRATDSAVEDGKQATQSTHANAVDNVDELARQLRQAAIAGVLSRLAAFLTEGQRLADAHSSAYFSYDGSWKSFSDLYSILVDITYKGGSPWYPKVFTEEGFYASETKLTDAYPDSSRGDGLPHVSVTNNGWLYGFQEHWYDSQSRVNVPFARSRLMVGEDPRYWLGGEYGDPYAVVRDRSARYKLWYVSPVTFPHSNREVLSHKISVFTPIYSGVTYRGFVQIDAGLHNLVYALSSVNKGLRNMSAFIVDRSTELLLATNKYYTTQPTFVRPLLQGPSAIIALYNITECPPVEVIAAGYYLKSMSNTTGLVRQHTGEFNQRAYYADPSHKFSVLTIQADASGVRDSNADKFVVEMRGPCATRDGCLAIDPATQRHVMRFEGSNTLQIYRNLTTNFPDVAASRVSNPGEPWQSSYGPFNRTLSLPGSSDPCVAMADERDNLRCMLQPLRMLGFATQTTLEIRFNPDETVPVGDLSQTLFSDAERGEAFLKVMASGRLIIGVHDYVCRTKPLAEPLAGGQWHTLTAVVDRLRGRCYMYVNGTLHDVSTKTHDDGGTQSSKPWVAGRFYKGSIASIKGFRIALNAKEVLSLYEDEYFTRDVPERNWFVEVDTLLRNSSTTTGINWGVVAMIPRSDVMRTVDEKNVITLANLKVQEDNTRAKQKQELYEAGLSVIVIALFSVLVFLVFNTLLTEPIESLAVTLHDAAYLKLGEIPTGNSRILEVAIIASAAANMLINLTEYRRYLPMHVKQDAQEQLEERCMSEDPKSHDGESDSRNSQNSEGVCSSGRGSRVFSFSRRASGQKVGDVRLSRKTVTTAVTNICGFQEATDKSAVHCVVLTRFLTLCATHRATADFTGDRFLCYWNAFKTLLDHRIRGLDLALKFHEVPMPDIKINTAICTGACQVGNLGNDEMRKPSIIGPVPSLVHALERVGRFTANHIVVDRNLRETTALHIIRVYDYACGAGLEKGAPFEVSVLEGAEATPEEAEWMYQLEKCANPYLDWNTLCTMVRSQDWENATTLLESGEFEAARKACPQMFTKYMTAVKERKQPPPLEIGVHDAWGKAHKTAAGATTRDEVGDNSS